MMGVSQMKSFFDEEGGYWDGNGDDEGDED